MSHGKAWSLAAAAVILAAAGGYAAGPFDGTYVGALEQVGTGSGECMHHGKARITIVDGLVTYNYLNRAIVKGTVRSDGSFTGEGDNHSGRSVVIQKMSGRINGAHLEADTSNQWCHYHLSLTRP